MPEEAWTWGEVFATLMIRFVGVFVVLAILQIGIQVSGWVIQRLGPSEEERAPSSVPLTEAELVKVMRHEGQALAPGVLGAITVGLHLYMEEQSRGGRIVLDPDASRPVESTAWQVYGRQEQFDSRKISRPW